MQYSMFEQDMKRLTVWSMLGVMMCAFDIYDSKDKDDRLPYMKMHVSIPLVYKLDNNKYIDPVQDLLEANYFYKEPIGLKSVTNMAYYTTVALYSKQNNLCLDLADDFNLADDHIDFKWIPRDDIWTDEKALTVGNNFVKSVPLIYKACPDVFIDLHQSYINKYYYHMEDFENKDMEGWEEYYGDLYDDDDDYWEEV